MAGEVKVKTADPKTCLFFRTGILFLRVDNLLNETPMLAAAPTAAHDDRLFDGSSFLRLLVHKHLIIIVLLVCLGVHYYTCWSTTRPFSENNQCNLVN